MHHTTRTLFAATLLAAASLPASAQLLPAEISPDLQYADTCFQRTYTAQHLRSNPAQRVTRIALAALDRDAERPNIPDNQSEMLIAVQVHNSSLWRSSLAYCSFGQGNRPSTCNIESDGGAFALTNRTDGTVMIRTAGALRVGADDEMVEFGGRFSDDNAFILPPASCRRAS